MQKIRKSGKLTKILAVAGTLLTWFPVLAPTLLAVASFFEKPVFIEKNGVMMERPVNFDFLMPAELFPFAFAGAALLLWAAFRAKSRKKTIGLSFLAAVVIPVIGQVIASVTGLASGETEPEGTAWALVIASLIIYCLALAAIGTGGILLLKDLFKSRVTNGARPPLAKIILTYAIAIPAYCLLLFLPAGTFSYWPGWLYMAAIFLPSFFIASYFMKKDPEFIRRRMQYKEKESVQDKIIKISGLLFFASFVSCGLDFHYGWSVVPAPVIVASNIIVFFCFIAVFFVFRENSYASRTIQVEKGQKVISTGPYAIVRHPMYTAIMVMYSITPVALGSLWGLALMIPALVPIIFRIFNEEEVLMRDLKGYKEYMKKVRFRLVPGLW